MINAEEHKKLLAQITELEKDSVNYFDVEEEFFLIDSNNLCLVRPRLYGYSIQRDGIYEEDNLTPEAIAGLDGRGCYVYVEVRDGKITIKQDINGCWGIYLFRHGDYFALSNSFFRLLDHVKFLYPLTVNRNYCLYQVTDGLCSNSYSETAVNEIELLDRSAVITIDTTDKNLQIELTNYKEYTVSPDSEEGIAILDNWFEFWKDVLHGVAENTKFFTADLTGGFDSRISLLVLLHSDVDLQNIRINSDKGTVHTLAEDYNVASKIAEYYGFELNKPLPEQNFFNYSLNDAWNIDLYNQQTVRNSPALMFMLKKSVNKIYHLKGISGETIRSNRFKSPEEYISEQLQLRRRDGFSFDLDKELSLATENILTAGFRLVCDKYKIEDPDSPYIPQYLYNETGSRYHHGREPAMNYLKNDLSFSPIADPLLRTLKLSTPECPDPNLLIALIFTRYEPDLLDFPFDSLHFISPKTRSAAREINERFPRHKITADIDVGGGLFHLSPLDMRTENLISSGRNNPNIPGGLPMTCLKAMFESSKTLGLFTAYFDEALYHYAADYYDTNIFYGNRLMYAIIGVTQVLEAVEISNRNSPSYREWTHSIEKDFYTVDNKDDSILRQLNRYIIAKAEVKLVPEPNTKTFQILSVTNEKIPETKLESQHSESDYVITSFDEKFKFVVTATADGQAEIILSGKSLIPFDEEDRTGIVPYRIDYTALSVNGKTIFDELTSAWHNRPYRHNTDVKAGEEIIIQVEWLPHRSNT